VKLVDDKIVHTNAIKAWRGVEVQLHSSQSQHYRAMNSQPQAPTALHLGQAQISIEWVVEWVQGNITKIKPRPS
jgi:hypothetical protein